MMEEGRAGRGTKVRQVVGSTINQTTSTSARLNFNPTSLMMNGHYSGYSLSTHFLVHSQLITLISGRTEHAYQSCIQVL